MGEGTVVITGACGFLGHALAQALPTQKLVLLDFVPPVHAIQGAKYVVGDVADRKLLQSVITTDVHSIYHLAAVLPRGAEADYELGLKVNVDGTRAVIEQCKAAGHCPRLVFTSSVAVFGPSPTSCLEAFSDTTTPYPRSSYGTQKVIAELLIADATRRGYIDGRCIRLPAIVVRPSRPYSAHETFWSSIIREPLNGKSVVCPVSPSLPLYVQSRRTVVQNIKHAMSIPTLRGRERAITLPGLTTTPKEMVDAVGEAGGDINLVKWEQDAVMEKFVSRCPGSIDTPFANSLGFHVDKDIHAVVTSFLVDNLSG